jgi:hypothetical protein
MPLKPLFLAEMWARIPLWEGLLSGLKLADFSAANSGRRLRV